MFLFVVNSKLDFSGLLLITAYDSCWHSARKIYILEGLAMHVSNEYMVNDSYMVCHLKNTKNEPIKEHLFKHYVYIIGEIKRLLALFGLNITALYDTTVKTLYQSGDAQVYLIAEKIGLKGKLKTS